MLHRPCAGNAFMYRCCGTQVSLELAMPAMTCVSAVRGFQGSRRALSCEGPGARLAAGGVVVAAIEVAGVQVGALGGRNARCAMGPNLFFFLQAFGSNQAQILNPSKLLDSQNNSQVLPTKGRVRMALHACQRDDACSCTYAPASRHATQEHRCMRLDTLQRR